jgi:hypothetical protein
MVLVSGDDGEAWLLTVEGCTAALECFLGSKTQSTTMTAMMAAHTPARIHLCFVGQFPERALFPDMGRLSPDDLKS